MGDSLGYQRFWKKLTNQKCELFFYGTILKRYVSITRAIQIGSIIITLLATGAWLAWKDCNAVGIACAIILVVVQALGLASFLFPFDRRRTEIQPAITELESLYFKMEAVWDLIEDGKVDEALMPKINNYFSRKKQDIASKYLKDDPLPEYKSLKKKAIKESEVYFENRKCIGGNDENK